MSDALCLAPLSPANRQLPVNKIRVVDFGGIHTRRKFAMKRRDFVRTMSAVGAGLLLKPGAPLSLYAQEAAGDPAVKRVLVMFK